VRLALAAFAGLAAAWLVPRVGGGPAPAPSSTAGPVDRPGVTAVVIPLDLVPEGVSFRVLDGVRVFLVRSGGSVSAFHGVATTPGDGPLWWCPRNGAFESAGGARYDALGRALGGSAPRDLERVRAIVTADRVTVFPRAIAPGPRAAAPGPASPGPAPEPCSAAERVG
jgi:hypothetical protein